MKYLNISDKKKKTFKMTVRIKLTEKKGLNSDKSTKALFSDLIMLSTPHTAFQNGGPVHSVSMFRKTFCFKFCFRNLTVPDFISVTSVSQAYAVLHLEFCHQRICIVACSFQRITTSNA